MRSQSLESLSINEILLKTKPSDMNIHSLLKLLCDNKRLKTLKLNGDLLGNNIND
jgi:hypothetical protein